MIVNKDGKSVTVTASTNDQSQPSPTKVRLRKSRRRHNGRSSVTSGHSTSSPVKSPAKEILHEELESKYENKSNSSKNDQKNDHLSPSAFKYMGPGTAIRESGIEFSHSESEQTEQKNLNDVCFGCDGSCSDITCSSKRSSRISADVESNICDSECTSPTHQALRRIIDDSNMNPEEREETEIDSNQNLEQKSKTSTPEKTCNGNNTDDEVLADDVIPVDSEIPEIAVDAVTLNNFSNHVKSGGSLKRSISDNPMNQSPSKIPHMRMDSTDSEGQVMICRSIGIQARARHNLDDSWSEDEGAVGDNEEDFM
jgi:hypothetical protein